MDNFSARVVELVDTHDSKSCALQHVGSIPTSGTILFFMLPGLFVGCLGVLYLAQ